MSLAIVALFTTYVKSLMSKLFFNKSVPVILFIITDYIDEVLQEGDEREAGTRREGDDGGITFTAKSPRRYFAWYTLCDTAVWI